MRAVPARPEGGWDTVCLGETMTMLTPVDARPLSSRPLLRMETGGAESNVACGLAALGQRVAWLSRLGADPFGEQILADLAGRGVDVDSVQVDPVRRTGMYVKDPTPQGTTVYYYRTGSAASAMGPGLASAPVLSRTRLVHLTGITTTLSDGCAALVDAILAADATGPIRSFDVNYRPRLWSPARAGPVLKRLASAADVVFVGLDQARTLWGAENARWIRELLPQPGLLVVTDAGAGATSFGDPDEDEVHVPAPAVDIVEPVGAGDAFAAGYLSALLDGRDAVTRLRTGHLLAAAALRAVDDLGELPSKSELERQLSVDLGVAAPESQ
jgi:2-dehydro-3-deoxygluconokinase